MNINFSNDLGYGSVKGRVNGRLIHIPSIMAVEHSDDISDPVRFNTQTEAQSYMNDYLKHMDVSIKSEAIRHAGRFLVGTSANTSRETPQTFDVENYAGKSESDLSVILTLSIIAGSAVRDFFLSNNTLPTDGLNVNVNMVTALPIVEGTHNKTLDYYAGRYLKGEHQVTIKNFKDPVPVNINFRHVLVRLEGQVAVYDIRHAKDDLLNNIAAEFKAYYPKLYQLVSTPKELVADPNTLSVDIGEGTTDFAVFNSGRVNISASGSTQMGYGNVLESAADELQGQHIGIDSRAGLKALMNQPATWANAGRQRTAQRAIDDNTQPLIQQITDGLSKSLRKAKNNVDIIYVYGGGAIPLAKPLRRSITLKSRTFRGGNDIPTIFIDQKHAQYMNVDGLELILNALTH